MLHQPFGIDPRAIALHCIIFKCQHTVNTGHIILLYKILRIKIKYYYLNAVAYIIAQFNDTVIILYTVSHTLSMCSVG